MERILITGMGIVSPLGVDISQVYNNLLQGIDNMKMEERAYEGYGKNTISAQVDADLFEKASAATLERREELQIINYLKYAIIKAVKDARISKEELKKKRVAFIIGNNDGQSEILENYIDKSQKEFQKYNISKVLEKIMRELGCHNVRILAVFNTCTSSSFAIEIGERYLRADKCDLVIAGGIDTFSKKTNIAFSSVKAISSQGCVPFACERDGITIGEGAGIVIMEKEGDLCDFKLPDAYCEMVHAASSHDAKTLEGLDAEGILLAYNKLFAYSQIDRADIEYVVSHGTGTLLNDKVESELLQCYFSNGVKICSFKNMMGHMMSCSGVCSSIIICKILREGVVPGQIHYPTIDMGKCVLIKRNQIDNNIKYFVCNAFGFGGNNTICLYKKYTFGKRKKE